MVGRVRWEMKFAGILLLRLRPRSDAGTNPYLEGPYFEFGYLGSTSSCWPSFSPSSLSTVSLTLWEAESKNPRRITQPFMPN